jgi:hypothetical protein
MTGSLGPNDSRPDGDALDRAIDDALRAALRGGPGDLRTKVLARLEEPVEDRPSRWSTLLRPAMLPVAGAVLIVLGVAVSWWQVDEQLRRAGSGRGAASSARTSGPSAAGTAATRGAAPQAAPSVADNASPVSQLAAGPDSGRRRGTRGADRIFAASLLEMDALGRPKGIAAAGTVIADDDEPEPFLPGALGGDLGDPIKPIPRPRLVVIPTLVAAPIVTAPIVDAPPVSTLATPVSTLSIDNSSRDQTGPGKSGGVRP